MTAEQEELEQELIDIQLRIMTGTMLPGDLARANQIQERY